MASLHQPLPAIERSGRNASLVGVKKNHRTTLEIAVLDESVDYRRRLPIPDGRPEDNEFIRGQIDRGRRDFNLGVRARGREKGVAGSRRPDNSPVIGPQFLGQGLSRLGGMA